MHLIYLLSYLNKINYEKKKNIYYCFNRFFFHFKFKIILIIYYLIFIKKKLLR